MNIANWGMGTNFDKNGEFTSYGFPSSLNPERFQPDHEMCSPEEIKNHEEALKTQRNK